MDRQPRLEQGSTTLRVALAAIVLIGAGKFGIDRAESMAAEPHVDTHSISGTETPWPQADTSSTVPAPNSAVASPEITPTETATVTESTLPTVPPESTTAPAPVETVPPSTEVPPVTETPVPTTETTPVPTPETPVTEEPHVVSPIDAPIGGPVKGTISVAAANIRSEDTFAKNLQTISNNNPDFVALNEVSDQSLQHMEDVAKGYGAYRDNTIDNSSNSRNDIADAILWREDTWAKLDSGRVKITNHDYAVFAGQNVNWNRYAQWGVFKRKSDGAIVSFIGTHMMVNPEKYPAQWRDTEPPMTRVEQYKDSMDNLIELAGILAVHGPVFAAGDMNSWPDQGNWAAVPQMQKAGYEYTNDDEVIYIFNPKATKVVDTKVVMLDLHGDHDNKSVQTKYDMNGAGPTPATP